jgi:O-antigen ligase
MEAIREIFSGVEWSPSLIAFLYYYFVVITYWLPGADIAIVAALAFLGLRINELRIGKALIAFGLFATWAWVSYLTSPKQADAFEMTWALTKLWLVAFVAFNVIRTRAQIRFFSVFAVSCFMLFPLRGAFINYFGGYTVSGRALWNYTYNNPNDLAGFSLLFAAAALAIPFLVRSKLTRLVAVLSAGAMVLLIFFTQSRGTLLATGVVAAFIIVTRLRNPRIVVYTVAMIAVAAYFAPESVWNRLAGLSKVSVQGGMQGVDKEGSAEQRFQLMKVASRIAKDNAATGVGAGAYQLVHAEYARTMTSELPLAGGNKDAHNTYLRTAAELGLIGLVLFLAECAVGLLAAFRSSRGVRDVERVALKPLNYGLIAYLLAGMFGSLAYINVFHLHIVMMECVFLAGIATAPAMVRNRRRRV